MVSSLSIPHFERLLLRGHTSSLQAAGLRDAAALTAGHVDLFLPYKSLRAPSIPPDTLSVRIAHQCALSASREVTISSPLLADALIHNPQSHPLPLFSAYIAGVALLNAFLRDNWTGPVNDPSAPPYLSDAAPLYLSVDGEDLFRPAVSLYYLRAARFILVDSASLFVRAGASLLPWWAARAMLAHQFVLTNPAPSLQNHIFRMFASFLGPQVTTTTNLFSSKSAVQSSQSQQSADQDDDPDSLLPAPVADDDNVMRDEKDFHICVLNEHAQDGSLMALAYLELALAQKLFYDVDGALNSLRRASELSRVAIRMSGELGVRTKHQTKETAQLVARAFHVHHPSQPQRPDLGEGCLAFTFPLSTSAASSATSDSASMNASRSAHLPVPQDVQVDDPDVLGYVKLSEVQPTPLNKNPVESEGDDDDDSNQVFQLIGDIQLDEEIHHLTPLEQAVALAHASIVRARNASHTLTNEQMAPYVDIVLRNAKSPFGTSSMVQMRALLYRVSFERDRGRYLERCMAQMEILGKFVNDSMDDRGHLRALSTAERNALVLASSIPPRWELMKELAVSFGKIGLVKSAMEIFEKFEFWDELIDCHRLIGNLGRAEKLVREHLELLDAAVLHDGIIRDNDEGFNPSDPLSNKAVQERAARRPRLLCVLGEITRDRSHFETAWAESGERYARAKRALARWCVEREQWAEAIEHFRDALRLNPLFPEAWFTYGCAAIQVGETTLASNAFTMVVQQTPENAEAWNNLGRVLHDLNKKREALTAFMEAGKIQRDSWRIWNNIVIIATELRSSLDIVRGMERLLELRGKDGILTDAIGVAVAEVIRMSSSENPEDKAIIRSVCTRLLKVLGRCTAVVSTNASVWAAYAELHELTNDAESKQKAFDCRLKQVRSLIAYGDWKVEKNAFRHMVVACDAMTRDAKETQQEANIRAAQMQTDSILEQTVNNFKDDDGYVRLTQARQRLDERSQ